MEYSEFERGERQALLQVRSFIAMHGKREVTPSAPRGCTTLQWTRDTPRQSTPARRVETQQRLRLHSRVARCPKGRRPMTSNLSEPIMSYDTRQVSDGSQSLVGGEG